MQQALFDILIRICTLMCTKIPREYYNNESVWKDAKDVIDKYRESKKEEEQPTEIKTAEEILKKNCSEAAWEFGNISKYSAIATAKEYAAQFKKEDSLQKAIDWCDGTN